MIRLLGAALVLGCGAWMGHRRAGELERKTAELRSLADGLGLLGRELALRGQPLPELLEGLSRTAHGPAGALFGRVAHGLSHGGEGPFSRLWAEELTPFPPEVRDTLSPLGAVLGRFPGEEQRQAVEGVRLQVEELARRAGEDSRRLGRVYRAVGAAFGGFLLILLL